MEVIAMKEYMFDEKNGLWYKLEGDYYLPCLTAPEIGKIGIWGERRRQHLKNHQSGIYTGMLFTGKLEAHLQEVDRLAEEMYSRLVEEMSEDEGITEDMKATDQMAWVQQMNNICNRAAEIVREELIYA